MNGWGLCKNRTQIRCIGSGLSWAIISDIDMAESGTISILRSPCAIFTVGSLDTFVSLEKFARYSTTDISSSKRNLDCTLKRRPGSLTRNEIWTRMMRLLDLISKSREQRAFEATLAPGSDTKMSEFVEDDSKHSGPKLRMPTAPDFTDRVLSEYGQALHLMPAWLSSFERTDSVSLYATMVLSGFLALSSSALAELHTIDGKQGELYVTEGQIHVDAAETMISIGSRMQKPILTWWYVFDAGLWGHCACSNTRGRFMVLTTFRYPIPRLYLRSLN